MIAEIEAGEPSDEFYDAKVKVLSEEIEHHVEEEEKRVEGLFAQARKAEVDMDALGEQMADAQGRTAGRDRRGRPADARDDHARRGAGLAAAPTNSGLDFEGQ